MVGNFFFLITICIIVKYFKRLEKIFNIYDVPNSKRKIHKKKVSRFGGIFFFTALLIFFCTKLDTINYLKFFSNLNFVLIGFLLFFLGIFDDKFNLKPFHKFFFLTVFYFLFFLLEETLLLKTLNVPSLNLIIDLSYFSFFFTLLCFIILSISLNMFDGINLQSSLFLFQVLFFIFLHGVLDNLLVYFLITNLVFLFFNFYGKAFLGEAGVLINSLVIGIYFIKLNNLNLTQNSLSVFLLLLYPILDFLRVFYIRILHGNNPLLPDSNHIHHIGLSKFGFKNYIVLSQSFIFITWASYMLLNININISIFFGVASYFYIITSVKIFKKAKK
jgi:UDP-GlcNAc:undecaprenyl-phosphate GlcNAc-1-phosphate transferase